jgi:hypothetical protein
MEEGDVTAITQARIALAAGLLLAIPALAQDSSRAAPQAKALQTRVWVNNITRVYHCPGSSYYGNTRDGEFMKEAQARAMGFRALGRRACGNDATPARAPLPDTSRASKRMVWVNTESGIYHCPNASDWGATRRGKYVAESSAAAAGHRPAAAKGCANR